MLAALPVGLAWFGVLRGCRTVANVRRLAIVVAIAAFTVSPWILRNWTVIGKPTIATVVGGYTFWGANNEFVLSDPELRGSWFFGSQLDDSHPLVGDEVTRETTAWRYGFHFVRTHLDQMPRLIVARLRRLVSPFQATANRTVYYSFGLSWLLTAPFVAYGMFLVFRSRPLAAAVLLTPVLATIATTIVFYGSIRFRDSVAPLFLVFAAAGLVNTLGCVPGMARALRERAAHQS
jgi:hypothetical protein